MKIIEQNVKLVYPTSLEGGIKTLQYVEMAGRNCWRSEGKITDDSYKQFIENLRKRGHESPLEFGNIMFDITTSRDVMAELTRHRVCSFAIQSQRYVDESKSGDIEFIKPLWYKDTPDDPDHAYDDKEFAATMCWLDTMQNVEQSYKYMRDNGMKNQDAREVLTNAVATRIMMKCNLRELLHIYDLRSSSAALPKMQDLMAKLYAEVEKVLPGFLPRKEE